MVAQRGDSLCPLLHGGEALRSPGAGFFGKRGAEHRACSVPATQAHPCGPESIPGNQVHPQYPSASPGEAGRGGTLGSHHTKSLERRMGRETEMSGAGGRGWKLHTHSRRHGCRGPREGRGHTQPTVSSAKALWSPIVHLAQPFPLRECALITLFLPCSPAVQSPCSAACSLA